MNIRNYFDINSLKRKRDDNDHESDVKAHNKRTKLVHDKSRKDQQNRSQSSATNKSKSIVCKTCGKGHQGTCMYIKEMNANHTNHEWLNSPAHIWFRDQHQSQKFKPVAAVRKLDKQELDRFNKGKLLSKEIEYINTLSYDNHNSDLLPMNILL